MNAYRKRVVVRAGYATPGGPEPAKTEGMPAADSSSRYLRDRQFWGQEGRIQPGKVVGWVFATEEKGARMK